MLGYPRFTYNCCYCEDATCCIISTDRSDALCCPKGFVNLVNWRLTEMLNTKDGQLIRTTYTPLPEAIKNNPDDGESPNKWPLIEKFKGPSGSKRYAPAQEDLRRIIDKKINEAGGV